MFHNAERLFKSEREPASAKRVGTAGNDLLQSSYIRQPWGQWEWPLMMSSPERAILELLDEVPQRETFHQADVLMEGLSNLSPRRLHTLLVACRSVKVKRLFLWFAERHHHAWLKKLDRKDIDLGHGKRDACEGRQAGPEVQHHCSGVDRCRWMRTIAKQATLLIRIVPLVAAETCLCAQGWNGNQSVPARHAPAFRRYRSDLRAHCRSRIVA